MTRRSTGHLAGTLTVAVLLASSHVAAQPAQPALSPVNALFTDYGGLVLREYPDLVTLNFGDHRCDDGLRDQSAAGLARRRAAALRERIAGIDAARLSPNDGVSLRVLAYRLDSALAIDSSGANSRLLRGSASGCGRTTWPRPSGSACAGARPL
jgi:hypothetical protein